MSGPEEQVRRVLEELGIEPSGVKLEVRRANGYDHASWGCTPQGGRERWVVLEDAVLCPVCSWEFFSIHFGPDGDGVRTDQLARVKSALEALTDGEPDSLEQVETGLWGLQTFEGGESRGYAELLGIGSTHDLLDVVRARLCGDLLEWLHGQAVEEESAELRVRADELLRMGQEPAGRAVFAAAEALESTGGTPRWVVLSDVERWSSEPGSALEQVLHWKLEEGALVLLPDAVVRALDGDGKVSYQSMLVMAERDEELVRDLAVVHDSRADGPQCTLEGALEVLRAL